MIEIKIKIKLSIKQGEYINTTSETVLAQRSELSIYPTEPGRVECIAVNSEGNDTSEAFLEITDIEVSIQGRNGMGK